MVERLTSRPAFVPAYEVGADDDVFVEVGMMKKAERVERRGTNKTHAA